MSPRVGAVSGAAVRLPSPFLLGQAAIAGASDAIPNGNLVYVCGNSGISVFDVTNVTAPQLLRTVGTPANTCQIRNPQRLGSTPEIPYNFARDLAIADTHAFVATLTFDFFLPNRDIFRHTGDVLSIDLSVPSAPLLDGVLLNTNGTNNDGIGVVGGIDPSGGNFNMFSLTQADAQTLLVSSTTVTGGDTQTGTGLVRVLDIGAPSNLSELRVLQIPGAVHLIGLAIQGNRALTVASSGGWQDFFTDQNAGLSGNTVLAILDTSDPRNPQPIATRALSRASCGVTLPVSFGNDKYAFASLGAS
jgi:large repetitive protein